MKTKFIGIEGFDTIESISPKKNSVKKLTNTQKTVRFIKRASKLCAKSFKKTGVRAKSLAKLQIKSAKTKKASAPSVTARAYSSQRGAQHMNGSTRISPLRKRTLIAVLASLAVITVSAVTVAGALSSPNNTEKKVESAKPGIVTNITATVPVQTMPAVTPTAPIKADSNDLHVTDNCASLTIDGELIGYTNEPEALEAALDKLLVDFREGYDDQTTTEFANDVAVEGCAYDKTVTYMTAEELMNAAEGRFSISLSTDWVYDEDIPYETEVEYDDDEDTDYEKVTQEGENGTQTVHVRVTYVDGEYVDSTVTTVETVKEPVSEKITYGTKEPEKKSGSSTGSFMWPAPHTHSISSYMEWRWGRMHNGIDIAGGGDYGQPFVAADGGTVTWAGNDGGGYGNYVIVDHGNGYETVYAHACELAVSTGEYVSQGQTLGYIGSTGNSTGPHLHFEVRLGGDYMNPLDYVS